VTRKRANGITATATDCRPLLVMRPSAYCVGGGEGDGSWYPRVRTAESPLASKVTCKATRPMASSPQKARYLNLARFSRSAAKSPCVSSPLFK